MQTCIKESWSIAKEISFDYGHRVYTQKLNTEFSLDDQCVCRHLHGHRGTIIVGLEGSNLNSQGMITDFKHLNWFKKFIDDVLDHKMVLDINDPALPYLFSDLNFEQDLEIVNGLTTYKVVKKEVVEKNIPSYREILEGLVFIDFVPTSEKLSQWLFDIIQCKMAKIGVQVGYVKFFETPKSSSVYTQFNINI